MFDPSVLDEEARRFDSLAAKLEGVRESYSGELDRLDWEGERADSFAGRRTDREADMAAGTRQLREVAAAIRHLAEGVRAAIQRIKEIAAAVRDFFRDLAAAAKNYAENMLRAQGNMLEGGWKFFTGRPGEAIDEFGQAFDNVLDALPIRRDELPEEGDPKWFDVDMELAGSGDHGVRYQAKGRPAEAA